MNFDLQKASMWKRISAYLFDVILLGIITVGVAFLLSAILGYDSYSDRLETSYEKYEALFDVDFDTTTEDYAAFGEVEKQNYDAALQALSSDEEVAYLYSMLLNLSMLIITFSLLFGYLLLEFLIPLLLKNGQTLGKKIFGIGVMRADSVKITPILLLIRTVLGKYTVETMIPVFIILMIFFGVIGIGGTAVISAFLILQIVLLIATKARTPLHDLLAKTVTVDLSSQMIFENEEALIEYKKKRHAEKAAVSR